MPNALKQILRRLRARRPARRRRRIELPRVLSLETRILPTAVVTFNGAAMTIKGDTGPNDITVERIGNQVHVDANGGLITVNGTDVPDFFFNLSGAFNLTATFQADDDVLLIQGGLQLKSANIRMGDGLANTVTIIDTTLSGKLTIDTDDGIDSVSLINTSVTGTTLIDTGWSTDVIFIVDGTYTGATTIKTDTGDDLVTIVGTSPNRAKFVGKLSVTTGDDVDTVIMTSLDTKAFSIDTGDTEDAVILSDILVNGGISLKTGAGEDLVTLDTIIQSGTGANLFDTGSSADTMTIAEASFSGATTINVGSGTTNVLAIDDVTFNGTFTFNSQGASDVIVVEQNGALAGATNFVKAAKFNFGIANTMFLSTAATQTNFLSSVAFTGRSTISTVVQGPNTSFAIAPVLKNILLV